MREQYRTYLTEEAARKGVSEERLLELALAQYQMIERRRLEGYRLKFVDPVMGREHPDDSPIGLAAFD